jgi:hypothetical protein
MSSAFTVSPSTGEDFFNDLKKSDTRRAAEETQQKASEACPYIPWPLAELIYEAYATQYGTDQSLQKLHDRGGFSWREVEVIFSGLAKSHPKKLDKLRERHRIPYINPVRDRH